MNHCPEFREHLEDAALGDAPAPEFTRHLAECPACTAELARQRALVQRIDAAVHAVVRAQPPSQLHAGVAARLTAARPSFWNAGRVRAAVLAAAVAAALTFGIGLRALDHPSAPAPDVTALTSWHSPTASLLDPEWR
jgi:anti-sigma factor RsiW